MVGKKKHRVSIALFFIIFFAVVTGVSLGFALARTRNLKNNEHFTDFNPALPTRILDIRGELITEFSSEEKREIITLDHLPKHMINALLSREDQTFYEHGGYNIKAILRAVFGKLTGRSLGGGSTITQQLAGTLYLDRSDISLTRKFKELWWALQLERRYSKDEILELYLNKMYFGGGTYGVNAASRFYFGHSATEITPAEAAILVIQLSNPAFYNPFEHPNRAMDRQQNVLDQMVSLGYLDQKAAELSFDDYWATFDFTRTASSAWLTREDKARWFSEYVRRQLETMMYGTMDIYSGGYTVHTTLDLRHQAAADTVMKNALNLANRRFRNSSSTRFAQGDQWAQITELMALTFNLPPLAVSAERLHIKTQSHYRTVLNPIVDMMSLMCGITNLKMETNKSNANAQLAAAKTTVEGALISIENETGYITALVGGSKFDQSNQIIRATQAQVQPGSTFKPLYYSAAIDSRKFTAGSMINDTPIVFFNESGVPYTPLNFRGEWKGTVLLWEALSHSMNVPSLRILDGIGFDAAINRAATLLGYKDKDEIRKVFPRVYSLGLGVISVSPLQMARAFSTFGNQGKEVTPIAIRSVEDRNGKTILDPERELRLEQKRKGSALQIISPQNAFVMTSLLRNTISSGTLGWASGYERKFSFTDDKGRKFTIPAGGKTGTTQNWADAWTVGFTPYYTSALWFGFDRRGLSLGLDNTGATLAGPAWGDYMHEIHKGLPYRDFVRPQNGLVQATVCKKSGLLPTEHCTDGKTTLDYLEGTQPTSYCTYHERHDDLKRVSIDRLQQESYSVGQRPITVDRSSLLVDPDVYTDPEPRVRRSPSFFRGRSDSSSTKTDDSNEETEDGDYDQETDTNDIERSGSDSFNDTEDHTEPTFNPLLD
ncbi:MAG TPA: PBP1A family penicillin-binding protein [Treponema sp.]|nr:PBP1A family penicillin-binding protein [Treponema sp.]